MYHQSSEWKAEGTLEALLVVRGDTEQPDQPSGSSWVAGLQSLLGSSMEGRDGS